MQALRRSPLPTIKQARRAADAHPSDATADAIIEVAGAKDRHVGLPEEPIDALVVAPQEWAAHRMQAGQQRTARNARSPRSGNPPAIPEQERKHLFSAFGAGIGEMPRGKVLVSRIR